MSDNEIMHALCQCSQGEDAECRKCAYADYDYCHHRLFKDALDLINRQQAELEDKFEIIGQQGRYIKGLKEENEKIKTKIYKMAIDKALAEKASAEAIKEFAAKLENRFFNYYEVLNRDSNKRDYRGETLMVYEVADMIEDCIDGTLKEMVGADNG